MSCAKHLYFRYAYTLISQDYILNYPGIEAMNDALNTKFSSVYKAQSFSNFNVRGQAAGLYKNAGTFSYLRFFGSGHEVPAYKVSPLRCTYSQTITDLVFF